MKFLRSRLSLSAAFLLLALLPSCQMPTPATRIAQRPATFEALPKEHKALVQRGEVKEGMSKDAVWVAWGSPSRQIAAEAGGKRLEVWSYTDLQPIFVNRMYINTQPYSGRCGRHFLPAYGFDHGPIYIPYTAAQVKFFNNKVAYWERGN